MRFVAAEMHAAYGVSFCPVLHRVPTFQLVCLWTLLSAQFGTYAWWDCAVLCMHWHALKCKPLGAAFHCDAWALLLLHAARQMQEPREIGRVLVLALRRTMHLPGSRFNMVCLLQEASVRAQGKTTLARPS